MGRLLATAVQSKRFPHNDLSGVQGLLLVSTALHPRNSLHGSTFHAVLWGGSGRRPEVSPTGAEISIAEGVEPCAETLLLLIVPDSIFPPGMRAVGLGLTLACAPTHATDPLSSISSLRPALPGLPPTLPPVWQVNSALASHFQVSIQLAPPGTEMLLLC